MLRSEWCWRGGGVFRFGLRGRTGVQPAKDALAPKRSEWQSRSQLQKARLAAISRRPSGPGLTRRGKTPTEVLRPLPLPASLRATARLQQCAPPARANPRIARLRLSRVPFSGANASPRFPSAARQERRQLTNLPDNQPKTPIARICGRPFSVGRQGAEKIERWLPRRDSNPRPTD